MTDKIAEIRERHAMYPPGPNARHSSIMAYQDRAFLLAEVDRLRKEMCEIAEDCESEYPSSYKKIAWFIRNALEAKP